MVMTTVLHTADSPYLTTNSPPPTTYLALSLWGIVQSKFVRIEGCKWRGWACVFCIQLIQQETVTSSDAPGADKQKSLSNAMDGLHVLHGEHMLRTQWKGSHVGTLSRQSSSQSQSRWGLDYTHMVYIFTPRVCGDIHAPGFIGHQGSFPYKSLSSTRGITHSGTEGVYINGNAREVNILRLLLERDIRAVSTAVGWLW